MIRQLLAIACATGISASAARSESTPAAPPERKAMMPSAKFPSDPFAQAIAVRTVADFARRQRDAVAMITAARMLQEIPFADPDSADATFTPSGLFGEARVMAKGNAALLMQITVAQSTGTRGVRESAFGKGLVRRIQTVDPRGGYQFTVNANGGEPLRIGAIGDVGTMLVLRIQDGAKKTVCLDDNADYGPVCQVTPKAAATFRVDVLNKSAVKSRAVILSN